MKRILVVLALVCPVASAQTPQWRPNYYDHLWAEARYAQGAAIGLHTALKTLLDADAETGENSAVCQIAREATDYFAHAAKRTTEMGERPEGAHQSREWIRSQRLQIEKAEVEARAMKAQACAPA